MQIRQVLVIVSYPLPEQLVVRPGDALRQVVVATPRIRGTDAVRSLQSREEGDILIITLDDPSCLNEGRADTFRESLYDVVSNHAQPLVVLNLEAIEYLSSSGVALLIGLKRRLSSRGGTLVLADLQPYIKEILNVMKLLSFFTISENEAEAIALLQSSKPE